MSTPVIAQAIADYARRQHLTAGGLAAQNDDEWAAFLAKFGQAASPRTCADAIDLLLAAEAV